MLIYYILLKFERLKQQFFWYWEFVIKKECTYVYFLFLNYTKHILLSCYLCTIILEPMFENWSWELRGWN